MEHSFHTVNFSPMFGSEAQLPDVLAAASGAGFTHVGLDVWGVEAYLARGARAGAGLADLLDDNSLSCTDVLAISIGPDAELSLQGARQLAEIASVTGARVCVAAIAEGVDPLGSEVRTLLRRSADIVADAGARLALEFLPYSPLKTVAQAQELYDDILDQSRNLRRMPGEGNLKLRDFVEAVKATGCSGLVSPEVLSHLVRQGPPLDFARSVRAAMIAYWE